MHVFCSELRPAASTGPPGALAADLPAGAGLRAYQRLPGAGQARGQRLLLRAAPHARHIQVRPLSDV